MQFERDERSATRLAWGIHLLTASGALCGLFGLLSVLDGRSRAALLWLMLALVIDGIDGPVARKVDVRLHVPDLDGNILDLVIDYLTCVVAPAVFLDRFGMLPHGWSLVGAGFVMLTALYCFARLDQMTEDHFFNGFPAMWSLVVNLLWVLKTPKAVNLVVVLLLSVLTLTDIKVPHLVRVRQFRVLTLTVVITWLIVMTILTISYPATSPLGSTVLVLGAAYLVALSVLRTRRSTLMMADVPNTATSTTSTT